MIHTVREIRSSDFEDAHRILVDAFDWMIGRGIRQWITPPSREDYFNWQNQGFNYGLFADDRLAVVFSIVPARLDDWENHRSSDTDVSMLMSLATALEFRRPRLGERALKSAIELVRPRDLYLECVFGNGFLPNYYAAAGFRQIDRSVKHFGDHGDFDMVLMAV